MNWRTRSDVEIFLSIVLLLLALVLSMPAHAQETTYNVVLTVPGPFLSQCSAITQELVNGQPVDLSKGAGLSVVECPDDGSGGFSFQLPPIQPWAPGDDWYGIDTPASMVQRGAPVNTGGSLYTEVDTFSAVRTYTFFNVYLHTWSGTVLRHLQKVEHCRFGRCTFTYKDLNNEVTATLVVTLDLMGTVHPVECHSTSCTLLVYRCGEHRENCFHRVVFSHISRQEF